MNWEEVFTSPGYMDIVTHMEGQLRLLQDRDTIDNLQLTILMADLPKSFIPTLTPESYF